MVTLRRHVTQIEDEITRLSASRDELLGMLSHAGPGLSRPAAGDLVSSPIMDDL